MNLDTRTRRAMLAMRASLEREGLVLMGALSDAIKAHYTRAQCAKIAAVLQWSIGQGEMPNADARELAAQVWDALPETLQGRVLSYEQRAHALEGDSFTQFLVALGAPNDVCEEYIVGELDKVSDECFRKAETSVLRSKT